MKKNIIVGRLEYIGVKFFYIFVNLIPLKFALFLGMFLGTAFYKLDKKHAKSTIKNLRIAFPDKTGEEIKKIASNFYKNLGMVFIEIFRLDKYNEKNIDKFVTADFNEIKNIYGKKGILLLTAHFGNWELLAKTFSLKGYHGNVLARPLDNPYIENMLYKLRTNSGNNVIYNRENAVRNILQALNKHEIVGFLPDENASKRIGVFVDFFGVSACTMPGIANIAAKTRAAIVPAFIVRQGKGNYMKHKLIIEKPLEIIYTGKRKEDMMSVLNGFNKTIEDIIKKYPDQWFWIHNRWKTRPDD
jgi:KDO2-lipid IV(A) lauroyltransferase